MVATRTDSGPDGLAATLVRATSRALRAQDCADLTRSGRRRGRVELDAEAIPDWLVGQYRPQGYPAVVLGCAHGSCAHLAAALGAPWLPADFDAGSYHVRWRGLPRPYRRLLEGCLDRSAAVVLIEDRVAAGFANELRDWAGAAGVDFWSVHCGAPEQLSAVVADLYRMWLRKAGKTGNRLVFECGQLLDPYQVLRAGLVPYWCESDSRTSVRAAELWLAGSSPYTSVDIIVGRDDFRLQQWRGLATFATRRGRAYPVRRPAPRRATAILRHHPYDVPLPVRLDIRDVLAAFPPTTVDGRTDA